VPLCGPCPGQIFRSEAGKAAIRGDRRVVCRSYRVTAAAAPSGLRNRRACWLNSRAPRLTAFAAAIVVAIGGHHHHASSRVSEGTAARSPQAVAALQRVHLWHVMSDRTARRASSDPSDAKLPAKYPDAAQADYIVNGNKRHWPVGSYGVTRMVGANRIALET